ncbi:hypothetical protein VKS41_006474 [Umbelopsis sp. WA50703]
MDTLPSEILSQILSMTNKSTLRECTMVNREWHTHGQKFLYTSLEFEVKYFKSFFDAISSSFKVDPRFLGQYVENFEMHMGDVLCPRDDDEEEEDDDDTTST